MINYPAHMPIAKEKRWVAHAWLIGAIMSAITAAAFTILAYKGGVPPTFATGALISFMMWVAFGTLPPKYLGLGLLMLMLLLEAIIGTFGPGSALYAVIIAVALWRSMHAKPDAAIDHEAPESLQ